MVVHGRLQLLPRSTRIESAVVRLGGEKMLRAAYPRDGREPNRLHLDGSRCASHSRLSSGRCEMITRYYHNSLFSNFYSNSLGPGPIDPGSAVRKSTSRRYYGEAWIIPEGSRSLFSTLIGVSMRRHILSRANVVASERQLDLSQSPFALRFYSHSA